MTTCPQDVKIHSEATIIKIAPSGQEDRRRGQLVLRVPGEPAGRAVAQQQRVGSSLNGARGCSLPGGKEAQTLQHASTLTHFKWIRAGCVQIIKYWRKQKQAVFIISG